jgi:hypothetical protein
VSRPALGPTQIPTQWVTGAFTLEAKRLGFEADQSPPSSGELKEYAFIAWCSVKKTQGQLYLYLYHSVCILTKETNGVSKAITHYLLRIHIKTVFTNRKNQQLRILSGEPLRNSAYFTTNNATTVTLLEASHTFSCISLKFQHIGT